MHSARPGTFWSIARHGMTAQSCGHVGRGEAETFNGHHAAWTHHADTLQDSLEEHRSFSLRLPKRHAVSVLPVYLTHLATTVDHLECSSRARRLHTNAESLCGAATWSLVPFCHSSRANTAKPSERLAVPAARVGGQLGVVGGGPIQVTQGGAGDGDKGPAAWCRPEGVGWRERWDLEEEEQRGGRTCWKKKERKKGKKGEKK